MSWKCYCKSNNYNIFWSEVFWFSKNLLTIPFFSKDREFIEIEHHLMSINVNTQLVQLKIQKPEEQETKNTKLVNLLNCLSCNKKELEEKSFKNSNFVSSSSSLAHWLYVRMPGHLNFYMFILRPGRARANSTASKSNQSKQPIAQDHWSSCRRRRNGQPDTEFWEAR